MRTTIRLDDGLLADAKQLAAERGTTLGAVVEDALRERLVRVRAREDPPASELRVFRGGRGPGPGVDLDDNAGLRDLLDEDVPPEQRR